MGVQGPLHVRVGIGDPGLAQVARDRTQDHYLPARQPGPEDQAAQAVVLELTPLDADERLPEQIADALQVLGLGAQPEVVDPQVLAVVGRDPVRTLVHDSGAHVLEGGQDVG